MSPAHPPHISVALLTWALISCLPPHLPWRPTLHLLLHAAFAQPWVQPWPSFHPGCQREAQEKPEEKGRKWLSRPLNHDILLHSWRSSHPHFLLPRMRGFTVCHRGSVLRKRCPWARLQWGWCGWGGVTYPTFLVGLWGFKWHNG